MKVALARLAKKVKRLKGLSRNRKKRSMEILWSELTYTNFLAFEESFFKEMSEVNG